MSEDQDDKSKVRDMTRRSIMVSTYLISPLLIGMAACASTIVSLILTDKWLPCVPYMQIFCLTYLSYPIHTANLNAIKAMGRSDLFLKLEIIKKALGLTVLFAFIRVGVMELALSLLFVSTLCMGVNAWPNKQLLSYSIKDQILDILTNLVLALVMGAIVWAEGSIAIPVAFKLVLQVATGVFVYAALSLVTKNSTFTYLLDILKTGRKKA
jgi:O-antigen/teichoic acid export membrane protein